MTEFTLSGHKYMTRKLPMIEQFHISRKLTPYVVSGSKLDMRLNVMAALARLSDSDAEYVTNCCILVTQRKQPEANVWANIGTLRAPMFDDISPLDLYEITAEVIVECLTSFFTGLLSRITEAPTMEA